MSLPLLLFAVLCLQEPPTPGEDAPLEALRALVTDLSHVAAERRGEDLALVGWTTDDNDRTRVDRILARHSDVLDLTTSDLGDPHRMIEVDAVLFLVRAAHISSVGFDFLRMINMNLDVFSSDHRRDGIGLSAPGVIGPVSALSQRGWMVSASADYDVTIANATDELVAILSRPHLTAVNGSPAEFLAGGEIVFQVQGIESGDIKPYPFGTSLKVTPTLLKTPAEDGSPQVMVEVEMVRTSILDLFLLDQDLEGDVIFDKVSVTSKAVLGFGDSLILSGLYQRERRSVRTGVPVLRDIPLLKYLFSTEQVVDARTSIIVLLTPREPALVDEENSRALDEFVARRREWIEATEKGPEAMAELREQHPKWFSPAPNRYASHFFLQGNSELYRKIRGEDLTEEALEFDLIED